MKYVAALLAGLLVGGLLTYFLFVGAPRMEKPPGEPVRAPAAGGPSAGTVSITLDEPFFNTLLEAIFRDVGAPTFNLSGDPRMMLLDKDGAGIVRTQDGGCQNKISIVNQASDGTQTSVRLQNGEIVAPLAFNGTYNVPLLGCQNFSGAADAQIALYFRAEEQTLFGQINVRGVNLSNIGAQYGPLITPLVQTAINQRVNPLTILSNSQINLTLPVQAAGGTLRAQARGVSSEVKDGKLVLFVTYDFSGGASAAPAS